MRFLIRGSSQVVWRVFWKYYAKNLLMIISKYVVNEEISSVAMSPSFPTFGKRTELFWITIIFPAWRRPTPPWIIPSRDFTPKIKVDQCPKSNKTYTWSMKNGLPFGAILISQFSGINSPPWGVVKVSVGTAVGFSQVVLQAKVNWLKSIFCLRLRVMINIVCSTSSWVYPFFPSWRKIWRRILILNSLLSRKS